MRQTIMQNSGENAATVAETVAANRQERTHHGRTSAVADGSAPRRPPDHALDGRGRRDGRERPSRLHFVYDGAVEERPYHTVFIDMQMPNGGGAETAGWLRDTACKARLLASALMSATKIASNLSAGCAYFIERPLTNEQLQTAFSRSVKQLDEVAPAAPADENAASDQCRTSSARKTGRLQSTTRAPSRTAESWSLRMLFACKRSSVNLQRMNFDVDMANNGQVACDMAMQSLADRSPYDVIFTDIWMPKMDGKQATKWLRENGWKGPIIAISSHNTAKDHTGIHERGLQ